MCLFLMACNTNSIVGTWEWQNDGDESIKEKKIVTVKSEEMFLGKNGEFKRTSVQTIGLSGSISMPRIDVGDWKKTSDGKLEVHMRSVTMLDLEINNDTTIVYDIVKLSGSKLELMSGGTKKKYEKR